MRFSLFTTAAILAHSALLVASQRKCGTYQAPEAIAIAEQQFAAENAADTSVGVSSASDARKGIKPTNIKVHFHVIRRGETAEEGNVLQSQIVDQINVLNKDFKKSGLTFTLVNTTRTLNTDWYSNAVPDEPGPVQDEMKKAMRSGGRGDLNVYTVGFEVPAWAGLLGYATFPSDYKKKPWDDGIVLVAGSLPGGSIPRFNLGTTLTHEVGHWVGLYHTFEGGCKGAGDLVRDTAPEAEPSSGCPIGQDTCKGGGVDPIHNYMDYSDDACMEEFSAGQISRLRAQIRVYRGLK